MLGVVLEVVEGKCSLSTVCISVLFEDACLEFINRISFAIKTQYSESLINDTYPLLDNVDNDPKTKEKRKGESLTTPCLRFSHLTCQHMDFSLCKYI